MALSEMFATMLPVLDERQRRYWQAQQAPALGRGGIAVAARTAQLSRTMVQKVFAEVDAGGRRGDAGPPPGGGTQEPGGHTME